MHCVHPAGEVAGTRSPAGPLSARLYSGRWAGGPLPAYKLLDEATTLAKEMAANPSRHLRWVKELLTANGSETDIAKVQQREGEVLAQAYASPEHKEAVDAFLAKRKPDFQRGNG